MDSGLQLSLEDLKKYPPYVCHMVSCLPISCGEGIQANQASLATMPIREKQLSRPRKKIHFESALAVVQVARATPRTVRSIS